MKVNAASTIAVLALLLAGTPSSDAQRAYKDQTLELLRLLASRPLVQAPYGRWEPKPPEMDWRTSLDEADDDFKSSSKRSAVATALNSGRRRRQPTPALGKEGITRHVGVGVLSDVGSFFDSLRDNLETLTSLTPAQRSTLFQAPPSVVNAPSSDLTTADHSWRRMGIPTRTVTTLGCCGLDSAANAIPTYPHPHARFRVYRNTRDNYKKYPDPVFTQPLPFPVLFPEYFTAYEGLDSPILPDDSLEVAQRNEIAQGLYSNGYIPLDSELGRAMLLDFFKYGRPEEEG